MGVGNYLAIREELFAGEEEIEVYQLAFDAAMRIFEVSRGFLVRRRVR
jgi:hypothetical protein